MTPLEQYKRDGYYIVKGGLSQESIQKVYREAREIFAAQSKRVTGKATDIDDCDAFENDMFEFFEKDFEAFAHTGKTVQHGMELHKLGANDEVVKILNDFGIEKPVIAVRPAVQFNSRFLAKDGSKHWRMDAHQDWRAGQGSLDSVVLWFPLVNCGVELGALQVLPGSHKWGLLDATTVGYEGYLTDNIKEEDFVQTNYEVGDILIFSAFLIHRSGTNTTHNIRWSVQFRYNNLGDPTFIERGYPMPYIYKANHDIVTPNFPSVQQVREVYES
jgi:phytanoyl-CoA hydroxylase